jgi:hypothetical protein
MTDTQRNTGIGAGTSGQDECGGGGGENEFFHGFPFQG